MVEQWGAEVDFLGIHRLAVVLVQFNDRKHTVGSDQIELSLRRLERYYGNVSCEQMKLVWTVSGWHTLNKTSELYGQDVSGGRRGQENGRLLLVDSIRAAQYDLDFHEYQRVAVVYAGPDQRVSNISSDLWPHYLTLNLETDNGVLVKGAFYVSEFAGLGSYAHELGHSLGLADLYPQDETKRDLVGCFSLMDWGEWLPGYPNNSLPSGLDAWSLTKLAWITPVKSPS